MIKSISIKNFKGIGDEAKIDIKPITLLFGANSAGKSSILHAFQYLYEILDKRDFDAQKTQKGGRFIDLGGFENLLHRPSTNSTVSLEIGLEIDADDFYLLDPLESVASFLEMEEWNEGAAFDGFANFSSARVRFDITWSDQESHAYVSLFQIIAGEEPLLTIKSDQVGHRVTLDLNLKHPDLGTIHQWRDADDESQSVNQFFHDTNRSCLSLCLLQLAEHCEVDDVGRFYLTGQRDALPELETRIRFVQKQRGEQEGFEPFLSAIKANQFIGDVSRGIRHLIQIPLAEAYEDLKASRYLGPLRETPERHFKPKRLGDDARWATGLGAWDALRSDAKGTLLQDVNSWLSDESQLDCGYSLQNRSFFVVDTASDTGQWLASGTGDIEEWTPRIAARLKSQNRLVLVSNANEAVELRPSDVGTGISQLIPVVVTACDSKGRLITIEQPELHVHPRIQAEMGDLFIDAWQRKQNQFILETHSEHLILRLQRRVREQRISHDDVGVLLRITRRRRPNTRQSIETGRRRRLH